MIVGIPKETWPGETRVAVIPATVPALEKAGLDVLVERDAGTAAGFPDDAYVAQGGTIASRDDVFARSQIILQVRATPGDAASLRQGQAVVGFADPLGAPTLVRDLGSSGAAVFSMELMPRIIHDGPQDVEIPGRPFTFRTLKNAQATGDLQTLRAHRLPAERVRLEGDDAAAAVRGLTARIAGLL